MSETCKLNPQYKQSVLQLVYKKLYEKSEQDWASEIDHIATEHYKCTHTVKIFRYVGKVHAHSVYGDVLIPPQGTCHLDPLLVPDMQELLKKAEELTQEKAVVDAFLRTAFNRCKAPKDFLIVLPDCIHGLLPDKLHEQAQKYEATLSPESVQAFLLERQQAVQLITDRMLLNLLLT